MPFRPAAARAVAAVGALAVAATTAGAVAPASAAPSPSLHISYDTTGSTTLANPNSNATVKFRPSVLESDVALEGSAPFAVTATLPIAPVRSSYDAYGFLPVTSTVVFTQVRPIRGGLSDLGTTPFKLSATAMYVVSLRNLTVGGADGQVGTNCQTTRPVVVTVKDQGDFNLSKGTLSGSYVLPKFQNCGPAQNIINDTLPGPDNVLTLKIKIQDDSAKTAQSALAAARQAPSGQ